MDAQAKARATVLERGERPPPPSPEAARKFREIMRDAEPGMPPFIRASRDLDRWLDRWLAEGASAADLEGLLEGQLKRLRAGRDDRGG